MMIDCIVEGGQIRPVLHRILCDIARVEEFLEGDMPWVEDGKAILAFSDDERADIVRTCLAARVPHSEEVPPQPDPGLLAELQGRVTTRTDALAALESGDIPPMVADISDLDRRLKEVEEKESAVGSTPAEP